MLKRKTHSDHTAANYKRFKQPSYKAPSRYARAPRKVELKYDDGVSGFALAVAGTVTLLTTIANGSGGSERVGRHIEYSDIEMNWYVNAAAAIAEAKFRFILVHDKQSNGALATHATIMNSTDVTALMNPDNRSRFSLIYDSGIREHTATATSNDSSGMPQGHIQRSLRGRRAEFSGISAGIADIIMGPVLLVTMTNVAAGINFFERNRIQYFD